MLVLSVREHERSKVEALDAGADDYVTKPFGIQELLARVRAHLRRAPERTTAAIEAGDFVVDSANHSVTLQGKPIHLTPKEFDLLLHLARNAGKVMTHRALLTAVWGAQSAHQPEYLRVFVGQVRKKLEGETGKQYIQTEPWVGYRFVPEGWSGNEEQACKPQLGQASRAPSCAISSYFRSSSPSSRILAPYGLFRKSFRYSKLTQARIVLVQENRLRSWPIRRIQLRGPERIVPSALNEAGAIPA